MKNNRLPLIIIGLLSTTSAFANLVQVTKLHGNATYLSVGMKEAEKIVLNKWLPKDTSILTSDKTFLVLTYRTGSEITLGPNSKLLVDTGTTKEQQIVSLLIGKFKATVKNQAKSNDNKMIIKTTGAALGIRGTEFQASFNPETKITSLITFHGAVAMTKLNHDNITKIESDLKNNSVVVKVGEYSGVSKDIVNITAPVKISTDQFTKLKLAQTLGATEEVISEKDFKKELIQTEASYVETKDIKSEVTSKNVSTLRSGGFVDLSTGVYLPPPKNSAVVENLKVFETTAKMGVIDSVGNYTPPTGIKLDPVKGFVIDEKVASDDVKKIAHEMNESVEKQVSKPEVIIKRKKLLENNEEDVYKKYYDPAKI